MHTHHAGVRLATPPTEARQRQIRIKRGARLDLGRLVYEQLTQHSDVIGYCAGLGLRIRRASPEVVLQPLPPTVGGSRLYFSSPLVVVCIVTPDFTHAAIASWWLDKTPLIFVEKPFDSQLDHVYELLRLRGQGSRPAILGLDHYHAYALPLHELRSAVVAHLGEALAQVVFYMTADRPIELGRERSLQRAITTARRPGDGGKEGVNHDR